MSSTNKKLRLEIKQLEKKISDDANDLLRLLERIVDLKEEVKRLEQEVEKANELMQE